MVYIRMAYGIWMHIAATKRCLIWSMGTHFARAFSYGLWLHIFLELSYMVYESTFLLELSHIVYGYIFC